VIATARGLDLSLDGEGGVAVDGRTIEHLLRSDEIDAWAARHYQSLRHFDNLPQLPNGYIGMFLACYIPSLWFRLMDRRVVAWADGDASRIHFQPGRRDALVRRHGMHDSTEAA